MNRILPLFAVAIALFALTAVAQAVDVDKNVHDGTFISATPEKLVMTDKDGKEHSHEVVANVTVTIDGKLGKLQDLKAGQKIRVRVDENNKAVSIMTLPKDVK